MLKNGRTKAHWGLYFFGCSCCNSPRARRAAKGSMRAKEKASWRRDARSY